MFWAEIAALALLWFCTGYLVGQTKIINEYSEMIDGLFEETEDDDGT